MDVGVIGLGRMGLPMAGRLVRAGFPVTVWNRTPGRAAPLTELGARRAESPQALAASADVVITMLSDGPAVRAVLGGPAGVLAAARPGTVAVDMSTIGPAAARELAAEAGRHGVEFLDAPVSGSVTVAEQGMLTVMAGGPPDAFERVRPVLAAVSQAQLHLGPAGAGAAMKLAVNLVIAATNQSVAEALALAESYGIDRASAYDTLASSAVASPFLGYKRDAYLQPDAAPVSFSAALMSKDLELAIGLAAGQRLPLPVASAAQEFLAVATGAGLGEADFACVAQVLRDAAAGR
jgi:3-hydroxyisobutyrate dehydrogenase-like beta-hydroxyacid dehydrogenase